MKSDRVSQLLYPNWQPMFCTGRCSATLVLLLALLLFPARTWAQPNAGGAVQSLGSIAKHKSLDGVRNDEWRPDPNRFSTIQSVEMASGCTLSAANLAAGCTGTFLCDRDTAVPCLGEDDTGGGLDFVAGGTGLRNLDHSTIPLRGSPPAARAVAAWLYWGAIVPSDRITDLSTVVFAGKTRSGKLVGVTEEPCWQPDGVFAAWRADVLDLIPAQQINGDYSLAIGLPESSAGPALAVTDGRNPWESADTTSVVRLEGASLIVVYSHPSVTRDAQFFLHEGPHLIQGNENFFHQLDTALLANGMIRHLRLGGDGQVHAYRQQPVAPFLTLIAPDGGSWVKLRGAESLIDRHSDWQGTDGGSSNRLWDTQITQASGGELGLEPGVTAYWVRYENRTPKVPNKQFLYDCVAVVAHALGVH